MITLIMRTLIAAGATAALLMALPAAPARAAATPPTVIIDGKQLGFDTSNAGGGCQKPLSIVWVSGDATRGTGVGESQTSFSAGLDPASGAGISIFLQSDPTVYRVDGRASVPQSGSYTVTGPDSGGWYTFSGKIAELLKDANGKYIGGKYGPLHQFTVKMQCK